MGIQPGWEPNPQQEKASAWTRSTNELPKLCGPQQTLDPSRRSRDHMGRERSRLYRSKAIKMEANGTKSLERPAAMAARQWSIKSNSRTPRKKPNLPAKVDP